MSMTKAPMVTRSLFRIALPYTSVMILAGEVPKSTADTPKNPKLTSHSRSKKPFCGLLRLQEPCTVAQSSPRVPDGTIAIGSPMRSAEDARRIGARLLQ